MLGTHPLVRFLNKNRREIRITIIVIILFFLVLRFLNNLAKKQEENKIAEENQIQQELAIGNEHQEVIKKFLKYCVNGDESNAYALLSSECKKNSYKNLNDFKNNYIKKYFSIGVNYDITYNSEINEMYYYRVKITEDILSTGKVNPSTITQYFTIITENEEDKITIQIYE